MKQSILNTHFTSAKKKVRDFQLQSCKAKQTNRDKQQSMSFVSTTIDLKSNKGRKEAIQEVKNVQEKQNKQKKVDKTVNDYTKTNSLNDNYSSESKKNNYEEQFDSNCKLNSKIQNLKEEVFTSINVQELKYRDSLNKLSKKGKKRIMASNELEDSEFYNVSIQKGNLSDEFKHTDIDDRNNNKENVICNDSLVNQEMDSLIDKKGELEFKAKYLDKAINMLSMSTFQIIQNIRSFRAKRELEQIDENVELNSKPSLNNISKFVQNEEERAPSKESSAKHQKCVSFQIPQKQEPNSEISKISQETLNIINNIRNKKGESINDKWISDKPKTEREYKLDGILNNISMKEKYSELIEGDSMLFLPTHFKILQKFMRVLDDALIFTTSRGTSKLIKFDDVAASVESITNRTFKILHFAQLLTADPTFYIYEWNKSLGSKEYSLFINIPENEREDRDCANKRAIRLKNILIRIAKDYHALFLSKLKRKRPGLKDHINSYDLIDIKCWHHEFDPNNISCIPQLQPYNIGERPCVKKTESVSEFCKRNRSTQKNESLSKLLLINKSVEKFTPNILFLSTNKKVEEKPIVESVNGIPIDLFNRIQEKDRIFKEEKIKADIERNNNKYIVLKETLLKLIESIKCIYSVKRTNSLFANLLIEELRDTQRGCFNGNQEFSELINHLHMASPKWMKIILIGSREIVKIDPNYKKSNVKQEIEKYISELEKSSETPNNVENQVKLD